MVHFATHSPVPLEGASVVAMLPVGYRPRTAVYCCAHFFAETDETRGAADCKIDVDGAISVWSPIPFSNASGLAAFLSG